MNQSPLTKLQALAVVLGATLISAASVAEPPRTVVTVRPLHSLVASVMDGVASPTLLLDGVQSPHAYSMAPSDALALSEAELVVWVGEPLETFLERPLKNLALNATVIELVSDAQLVLRENREGAVWDTDGHEDEHDEAHHGGHDHDHDHADHHQIDGHVWLDPGNAKAIVESVASALVKIDPENATLYAKNAARTKEKIEGAEEKVRLRLGSYRTQPFLTSHDSLQYFDGYFDLKAVGAVTLTPDRAPSAKRISELRQTVDQLGAVCVFSEPGYEPRVIQVIAEAADVRLGVVDPLGINLSPGRDLYVDLMLGLADDLVACLDDQGD